MKKIPASLITFSFITISLNYGQMTPTEKGLQAITMNAIKAQLGFLASDWTEGRETGEKGEYLAADYIASMLQVFGVKPGGDYFQTKANEPDQMEYDRSYYQNFVLLKTIAGSEQIFKVKADDGAMSKTVNFTSNVDFIIRPSDPGIEFEAPVVFAGYGYKNEKFNYNDFKKLDVKGKFILKIAGIPKFIRDTVRTADLDSFNRKMESLYKASGAIGIIEFNMQATVVGRPAQQVFMHMSPSEGPPVSGKPGARFSIPGKKLADNLIKIVVSVKAANEILKGTGIDPDEYIRKADVNEYFMIPPIYGRSIYLKTTVKTTQVAVRNVLGIIEGKSPDKIIVLGAHYDHMGMGNGYIWNGADDNASGTVGVMTLARAIMETGIKPESTIIIALWTAEEEGFLGSRYYLENIPYPKNNRI